MGLDVTVFDVGRGLCASVRTPSGHLILIDCGSGDVFSPVLWLSQNRGAWTQHLGQALTAMIITHPHDDHLADLERVTRLLPPFMVIRRTDLNWSKALGVARLSQPVAHYLRNYLPPQYCEQIARGAQPDWGDGCELRCYWLPANAVEQVSSSDSSYCNNSSVVTILKYRGYTFAFTGDMEAEGMDKLLELSPRGLGKDIVAFTDLFGNPVGGVDFLVAPHHGHPSGFSSTWFRWTGPTRRFNLVSERRRRSGEEQRQTQVDSRYSQPEFSFGWDREERRMISTRSDGHLHVWITDDGKWGWEALR